MAGQGERTQAGSGLSRIVHTGVDVCACSESLAANPSLHKGQARPLRLEQGPRGALAVNVCQCQRGVTTSNHQSVGRVLPVSRTHTPCLAHLPVWRSVPP